MRILVVDDDPAELMLASIALEDLGGFDVILAQKGLEAVECAKRERPDAILIDFVLDDIDGPEVFQMLRSSKDTSQIPVIFPTAKTDPKDVSGLMALGAKGVIGKPFDPMHLAQEVKRILHQA